MLPKDISSIRWRLLGNMHQFHMDFFCLATTFAVIAAWAGGDNIGPNVLTAHMTRDHVIHSQTPFMFATVLAGIIVTAKNFAASQLDVWARPMNLRLQPNDRRTWEQLLYRPNVSTPVHHHVSFA